MLLVRAFSLIELMVVIAIVGLLATVAVPSYKKYSDRAKYSTMINLMESYMSKAKQYYMTNGSWPTATNLGYSAAASGSFNAALIASINPNLEEIFIANSTSGLTPCPNIGSVEFAFNPGVTSYSDDASFWYFGEVNGVIHTTCVDESPTGNEIVGTSCIDPKYPTLTSLAAAAC